MFIHEAIKARTADKPYITRKAWNYQTKHPVPAVIKLLPTNTPDCCVMESLHSRTVTRGWQPFADDLVADDWFTTE